MSKTLESLVKNLADTLENQPDPWFNDPCGWLYKPNFKREAQERASVIEHSTHQTKPFSWKRMVTGSPYKKRWFKLDIKKRILRYYKGQDEAELIGDLDMGTIVDVTFSKLYDAPEFALDLMTIQKHYTVAAESHAMMVKWAYAFRLAMQARPGQSKRDSAIVSALSKFQTNPNEKWLRYDFTYQDPGPLYLNVMGTCHRDRIGKVLKNSVVVISFEPDKDGLPGRSEKSGLISVGDFLVGYNGIDLTEYTFNDAVDLIISAPFPKTLNFLRDTERVRVSNRKEGWAVVYYPALTKYRRRYVEIRDDLIHFHKPAPGGAALSERDAFFDIAWVGRLRPVNDLTMPKDRQFILRLFCRENSVIEHVNEEDQAIGTTPVTVLDLCFSKESTMNSWRSILVSPSTTNAASTIQVEPLEVIQATESPKSKISVIGFKSLITGKFSPREFRLVEGSLRWKRLPNPRVSIGGRSEQSLFLANSHGCDVRSVKAIEDLAVPKGQGYRYQLIITAVNINYDTGVSSQSSITLGMEDERTIQAWLQLIRDCVSVSPPDMLSLVSISNSLQKTNDPSVATPSSAATSSADDDQDDVVDVFATMNVDDASDRHDDENEILKSYLYKRLERPGAGGSKPEYVKRWFTLKDHTITYYKSAAESRGNAFVLGTINVHQALSITEGGEGSPDNTFEIILPSKTHTFVAEDEDDMNQWIDAIGDILESREQVVAEDDSDGRGPGEHGKSTRMLKLQDASLYSGELQMKRFNRLTQKFVWRDRFIVIAAGSVYYYEHQEDFYDENKTCAGEIPVVAITKVESHSEPKVKAGCGFTIQARVVEGGDHEGLRTYIFEARLPELAKQWMEQVCAATGELRLEAKADGPGYESARIENAVRHIEKRRTLLAGSVRVDALMRSDDSPSLTPDTSPAFASVRRSPLERRTSGAGRSGRGFNRDFGSSIHEMPANAEASLVLNQPDDYFDEDETSLPTTSPALSADSRKTAGSSRRFSDGLGGNALAGRGRGASLAQGRLTPSTAFRRQSESRREASRRSSSPMPNESY